MTGIDRSSPMPLWAQLLDALRERLDRGEYSEAFPTDIELTAEYGLSRHTVREAVRRLQDEGLVTTANWITSYGPRMPPWTTSGFDHYTVDRPIERSDIVRGEWRSW